MARVRLRELTAHYLVKPSRVRYREGEACGCDCRDWTLPTEFGIAPDGVHGLPISRGCPG
jgi:hypothetical protein